MKTKQELMNEATNDYDKARTLAWKIHAKSLDSAWINYMKRIQEIWDLDLK